MSSTTSLLTEILDRLKNYFRPANGWEKSLLLDVNNNLCITIFFHVQSDTVQETGISSNLFDYTDSITIAIMIAFLNILKNACGAVESMCVCVRRKWGIVVAKKISLINLEMQMISPYRWPLLHECTTLGVTLEFPQKPSYCKIFMTTMPSIGY